jgi:nucleotide-binding universal stress UspA family protein
MPEFKTLVVPCDFSDHARAALALACDLAARLGSEIHLLHVIQPPTLAYVTGGGYATAAPAPVDLLELRESALKALDELAAGLGHGRGFTNHVVESPSIEEAIRECAQQLGADLIVMGTHGRTGLAHIFLGSVAERTLRRAPCPVLTVRASDAAEARKDLLGMETLDEAIERLERSGFRESFRAGPDGFLALQTRRIYAPESLVVEEVVRFEGESDPGDEAVLYALRARDESVRGTFVASFGPSADPISGDLIKLLPTGPG